MAVISIRVVIAADHGVIRKGSRDILADEDDIVAGSTSELVQGVLLNRHTPYRGTMDVHAARAAGKRRCCKPPRI